MGLNAAISCTGIAKQTAKGSAAAQPAYWHGANGSVVSADIQQSQLDIPSGTREPIGVNRTAVATGTDPKTVAFKNSIGLWLLAALGSVTDTGSSAPYTHTFGIGTDLPWVTLFAQFGGANFFALPDAKIDKLSLSWKGNDPLEVAITGLAGAIDLSKSSVTPTNDETLADYFTPVGGTFELDAGGTTLAAVKMTGGTFDFDNALDAVYASGTITPGAINPKNFTPGAKLSVMPDDLAYWKTVLTGTPTGTTIKQTTVYGSFSCKFLCGTDELTVKGQKVPFICKFPEGDSKGGTAEVELESTPVKKDSSTPSIEVILKNSVATYSS